jgi:hypothetical protein
MKRSWIAAAAMVFGWLVLVACSEDPPNGREPTGQAATQVGEPDGRIVFTRADPSAGVLARRLDGSPRGGTVKSSCSPDDERASVAQTSTCSSASSCLDRLR